MGIGPDSTASFRSGSTPTGMRSVRGEEGGDSVFAGSPRERLGGFCESGVDGDLNIVGICWIVFGGSSPSMPRLVVGTGSSSCSRCTLKGDSRISNWTKSDSTSTTFSNVVEAGSTASTFSSIAVSSTESCRLSIGVTISSSSSVVDSSASSRDHVNASNSALYFACCRAYI